MRSHNEERYGRKFIPADMTIQDWGVTYEELEPYYDKFEYLCGVSGKAGNVGGAIQEGGNPFEGARRRDYPLPPLKRSYATTLFDRAARDVGMHPFPCAAANTSQPYKNPLGVQMGQCTYCGYCEWFGCGNYSKASPQTTIFPVLLPKANFSYRTNCNVTRINLDSTRRRATGVTYVDAQGREFEQPADLVISCAFAQHNAHLLLLSGIGKPYDPQSGQGVVGRNYAYQMTSSVDVFFDELMNPFMGAGALGQAVDDFNGDNFDHGPAGFIGGGYLALWTTGGRPILQHQLPEGTPTWGGEWKKAMAQNYLRSASVATHGGVTSSRNNYLDLDPTYKDVYGNPLLRLTFDFPENDHAMSRFLTGKAEEIARAMKPQVAEGQSARGTLLDRALPDDPQHGRRDHGLRPAHQRGQPVSAMLGRVQRVRHGRERLSAECRLQPDGNGRCADVLGRGRDPQQIPQAARPAAVCLEPPRARS